MVERTEPDPEVRHHRQVYAPRLECVRVDLERGAMTVPIVRREITPDRFTRLVEDVGR